MNYFSDSKKIKKEKTVINPKAQHLVLTAQLSKFSHFILSNQISALCVDGKEQTHNYRLQLFKYCDM